MNPYIKKKSTTVGGNLNDVKPNTTTNFTTTQNSQNILLPNIDICNNRINGQVTGKETNHMKFDQDRIVNVVPQQKIDVAKLNPTTNFKNGNSTENTTADVRKHNSSLPSKTIGISNPYKKQKLSNNSKVDNFKSHNDNVFGDETDINSNTLLIPNQRLDLKNIHSEHSIQSPKPQNIVNPYKQNINAHSSQVIIDSTTIEQTQFDLRTNNDIHNTDSKAFLKRQQENNVASIALNSNFDQKGSSLIPLSDKKFGYDNHRIEVNRKMVTLQNQNQNPEAVVIPIKSFNKPSRDGSVIKNPYAKNKSTHSYQEKQQQQQQQQQQIQFQSNSNEKYRAYEPTKIGHQHQVLEISNRNILEHENRNFSQNIHELSSVDDAFNKDKSNTNVHGILNINNDQVNMKPAMTTIYSAQMNGINISDSNVTKDAMYQINEHNICKDNNFKVMNSFSKEANEDYNSDDESSLEDGGFIRFDVNIQNNDNGRNDSALRKKEQGTNDEMKMHSIQTNNFIELHKKENDFGNDSIKEKKQPTTVTTTFIPKVELPSLPPDLAYDTESTKSVDDEYRLQLIRAADLAKPLKNGWKLLPHQKEGIRRALLMRRLILAFDMGLGKTVIGCVYAKAFKHTFERIKIIVIAPVSLKKEWTRTALETTGLTCVEESKKPSKVTTDIPTCYDMEIFSWAKVPKVSKDIENYVVICDEAHYIQSMDTARTKETLKLVLSARCQGVLLLTGTPMKNGKPCNLFPLLKATRHPFGNNQKGYEIFFCNGQQKSYGNGRVVWDANGSSNLHVLHAHISTHMFCKTKEECLNDLPPKTREFRDVPVSSRFELQHNRAMIDLARAQQDADNIHHQGGQEALLTAFTKLRHIASLAKVDATVALVDSILREESSAVVFTYFVEVAKEIHKKLYDLGWKGEVLAGDTPQTKRQAMVDNFQAGVSPVFVATFGAGGVGITLTAARTIVLLDRPWTPGDAMQAEDRVRRIGQTRPVRSIWMRSFKVDEQIDTLLFHKTHNTTTVINGLTNGSTSTTSNGLQDDMNRGKAAPKISIRQLVESIISSNREIISKQC